MEEEILDKILTKVIEIDDRLDSFITKEYLDVRLNELITSIDRFAKLHETLDQELVALRSRYERLEERVEKVEQKLGLAAT